jgi:YVTN family beta-propeller protein
MKTSRITSALCACVLTFIAASTAEAQPFAYVANSGSNDVSVIDIATNTEVATVDVGQRPGSVAITPDGARAYVTMVNSAAVSVIDTATNTVTATITVGVGPRGVAITPDGAFAYVTDTASGNVSVIDIATNTVVATVGVGSQPFDVAITPDGAFAYLPNGLQGVPNNVAVIDIATNTVVATVGVGFQPVDVAITTDGAFAYVANFGSNDISVIDAGTNIVVATVTLGVGSNPSGVAITPFVIPPVHAISIDIKPGSDPNSINLCSNGTVPIAILGSDTLNVSNVNTDTLRFAEAAVRVVGKKDPHALCSYEDVNGDYIDDLVCHYVTTDIAGIDGESTTATLNGELLDGTPIQGTDAVNIVKDTCN